MTKLGSVTEAVRMEDKTPMILNTAILTNMLRHLMELMTKTMIFVRALTGKKNFNNSDPMNVPRRK